MATANNYRLTYSLGTIDVNAGDLNSTSTSIGLPGEGNVYYGQQVDQSLLNMLENFAAGSSPPHPIPGQLWYDNVNKLLKINVSTSLTPDWKQITTSNVLAAGTNTQVQFNDGGGLGASSNLTFNKSTNVLSLTGNIDISGNVNVASSVVANNNVYSNVYYSRSGDVTLQSVTNFANVNLFPGPLGSINVGNTRITNLAEPTENRDAVTKYYVDQVAQGVRPKYPCFLASTGPLPGTVVYYNGPANDGVGSTLTATPAFTTLDGLPITVGMRVLIKNQVDAAQNGIYVVTSVGATTILTRPDGDDLAVDWIDGAFVFVEDGVDKADTGWILASDVITVGISPMIFLQISAPGTYVAGTGLGLDGRIFYITDTGVLPGQYGSGGSRLMPVIDVNPQGQLTSVTLQNIQAAGSNTQIQLNDNGLFGATPSLTFNSATSVLGVTGSVIASSTVSAPSLAGTLTTGSAAQPNITSLGTLTSLTVSGLTSSGTFAGDGWRLGNITGANVTGTVASATNAQTAQTAGIVTNPTQTNIRTVGTLTGLNVGGAATVSGAFTVYGDIAATGEVSAFISDDRLKNKLGKIENALEKLLQLEGFIYEPNEIAQEMGYEKKKNFGVSAQTAQKVVPEVVTSAPIGDGYLAVKYDKIVPLIIESIRQLTEEINDLKKRV